MSFAVTAAATRFRIFKFIGLGFRWTAVVVGILLLCHLGDFIEQFLHSVDFILALGLALLLVSATLLGSGLLSSPGSSSSFGSFGLFLHLLNLLLPFGLLSPQALLFLLSTLSLSYLFLSLKHSSPSESCLLLSLPLQGLASHKGSLTRSHNSLSSQLEGSSSGCSCLSSPHQFLLALHLGCPLSSRDLTLLFGCSCLASGLSSPSGRSGSSSSCCSSPSSGFGSPSPSQG